MVLIFPLTSYKVAVSRTQPGGRVLGVDIIPAQPPKGVSAIQGDFLDPKIQEYVLGFVRDSQKGQVKPAVSSNGTGYNHNASQSGLELVSSDSDAALNQTHAGLQDNPVPQQFTVDVVLSDMSVPLLQTTTS